MGQWIEIADLIAYVQMRGYRAERIFNTTAMRLDGAPLACVGLHLIGPRGNKGCLPLNGGKVDLDATRLWCDGVDYATQRTRERAWIRARRAA